MRRSHTGNPRGEVGHGSREIQRGRINGVLAEVVTPPPVSSRAGTADRGRRLDGSLREWNLVVGPGARGG